VRQVPLVVARVVAFLSRLIEAGVDVRFADHPMIEGAALVALCPHPGGKRYTRHVGFCASRGKVFGVQFFRILIDGR
jgi:hypothetical protein